MSVRAGLSRFRATLADCRAQADLGLVLLMAVAVGIMVVLGFVVMDVFGQSMPTNASNDSLRSSQSEVIDTFGTFGELFPPLLILALGLVAIAAIQRMK